MSLWSWVNQPQELERLTNPLYEANSLVIWPSVAPQSLLLWEGMIQYSNESRTELFTINAGFCFVVAFVCLFVFSLAKYLKKTLFSGQTHACSKMYQ